MKEYYKVVRYQGRLYRELQKAESPEGDKKYMILLDVEADKTIVVEEEFFQKNFEEGE